MTCFCFLLLSRKRAFGEAAGGAAALGTGRALPETAVARVVQGRIMFLLVPRRFRYVCVRSRGNICAFAEHGGRAQGGNDHYRVASTDAVLPRAVDSVRKAASVHLQVEPELHKHALYHGKGKNDSSFP